MNKINCDVCGTSYPESASQCPICGCVYSAEKTAATDSGASGSGSSYTYVKGGRFSRSNVRKRNQGLPPQDMPQFEDSTEDVQSDDVVKADRGLIIAVGVLLLAIVAVVIYIITRFFAPDPALDNGGGVNYEQDPEGESISDLYTPEFSEPEELPADDEMVDPSEENAEEENPVEEIQPDSTETVPTEPDSTETEVQQPENDYSGYVKPFKTNRRSEVTVPLKDAFTLILSDANGKVIDVEWIVEDPTICSVKGNVVTGLKKGGTTTISVTIDGTTYACKVTVT